MYWCCCIDSQALDSTFAKDDTLLPITLRLATASRKGVRSERGQRSSLKRDLFLYVKKRKSLLNLSALLYFLTYLIKYAIIISEKGGETMANTTMNPSTARKNFYQLLKEVNENHTEIEIISDRSGNNAVLIGLEDWRAIQETLFLEQTGTLDKVRDREKDDSGFTNIDDIDWEAL